MAGKATNLVIGVISGRVGSVVGYKRKGDSNNPQGVRAYVQPSNPKTDAQAIQRAKFAGANVLAGILSKISDHNLEGKPIGSKNRAAYVGLLLKQGAVVAAKGSSVVAKWYAQSDLDQIQAAIPVSRGTLGEVANMSGLGPDALPEGSAIGELTAAKIAALGLQVGDILTMVVPTGVIADGALVNVESVSYKQYKVEVGLTINDLTLSYSNGTWTGSMQSPVMNSPVTLIIERVQGAVHTLTNSELAGFPTFSEDDTADVYSTYKNTSAKVTNYEFLYGSEL